VFKTITKNMFDVVTGVTIIVSVFYLAAITHMLPLRRKRVDASQRIFLKRHGCSVRLRFVGDQTFRGLKSFQPRSAGLFAPSLRL
jgi:hypothetical protein